MGVTIGHGDDMKSDVLDLTHVSMRSLRDTQTGPVLTAVLRRRFLPESGEIFPFQSYIDTEPEATPPPVRG
jgi:hypothetical protein